MSVDQSGALDLNQPKFFSFARDQATHTLSIPPIIPTGFRASAVAAKPAGIISKTPAGESLNLVWSDREHYQVIQGISPGQVIGQFKIIVIYSQKITIEVSSILFLRNDVNVAQQRKIEDAFLEYDYSATPDVFQFIQDKLIGDSSINLGMFATRLSYTLIKQGIILEMDEEKRAILAIYSGNGNGSIVPGPGQHEVPIGGEDGGGYFGHEHIRAVFLFAEFLDGVADKPRDPLHEVVTNDPQKAIEQVLEREGIDCEVYFKKQVWKIMNLFQYPEFRTGWHNVRIRLGCTDIVLTLPVTQMRISEVSFWAYARYPDAVGALVERIITDCLWFAALSATVVGIVVGDFSAALAAFRALFTECLKDKLGQVVDCMTPGIMLVTEVIDDWH